MAKQAAVTFFYQSGFSVALGKTLLVFSYWQHESIPLTHQLGSRDFKGFNNIVVFVPRGSVEHHDQVIYTWKKSFPITYVVSQDAKDGVPKDTNVRMVREGDSVSIAGVHVQVYGSTDQGVSFWVKTGGINIFHAGDLNLWHWREENTLREIARAEQEFYDIVGRMPKQPMEICMFPVDPNLGGFFDAGANHFIMAKRPSVFFPMHWGNRDEIAEDYARRMHVQHTTVYALTRARETALIDLTVSPPMVRNASGERKMVGRAQAPQTVDSIQLSAYISEDPFSETDLPVDMQSDKPGIG